MHVTDIKTGRIFINGEFSQHDRKRQTHNPAIIRKRHPFRHTLMCSQPAADPVPCSEHAGKKHKEDRRMDDSHRNPAENPGIFRWRLAIRPAPHRPEKRCHIRDRPYSENGHEIKKNNVERPGGAHPGQTENTGKALFRTILADKAEYHDQQEQGHKRGYAGPVIPQGAEPSVSVTV